MRLEKCPGTRCWGALNARRILWRGIGEPRGLSEQGRDMAVQDLLEDSGRGIQTELEKRELGARRGTSEVVSWTHGRGSRAAWAGSMPSASRVHPPPPPPQHTRNQASPRDLPRPALTVPALVLVCLRPTD